MKAKITDIKENGKWNELFKIEWKFDNGEGGSSLSKTWPPAQKVNDEVEFEIEEKNGHKNVKFAKAAGGAFVPRVNRDPEEEKKRQLWIVRQSSLKAATELVSNGKSHFDDILTLAETFTDWVMGNIPAKKMHEPTDTMPF